MSAVFFLSLIMPQQNQPTSISKKVNLLKYTVTYTVQFFYKSRHEVLPQTFLPC